MLPSGAGFEMATAAASTSTDEAELLVLCEAAVTGKADLSPGSAADCQLVCRLDLAAGSFVVHVTSQPHLTGSLRQQGTAAGAEQRSVASAVASQSVVLRRCLTALLLPQDGTASAGMLLSKQAAAHGWAAQLEASVAMDVITKSKSTSRSPYGSVPAIRTCAALAAPPPASDRDQPFTVSVNAHHAPRHVARLQMFSILDRGGMQQLQAADLAISARREANSGGWLLPSTAPALAAAWRPVAMPQASTSAKPAKWLIASRRPMPLSAICTLPLPAVIQTESIVYDTCDGSAHSDRNTIFVRSDIEAVAAMAASRADHIFCVCDGTAPAADDGLEAAIAAAAMLWAFRARARCLTSARMSLITYGQHIVGPDAASSTPEVAAATGALAAVVVSNE